MAMRIGLVGKKIGMTQVYADDGERIPVTVIQAGPCYVVGIRTVEKDGYSALVIGFDDKPQRLANIIIPLRNRQDDDGNLARIIVRFDAAQHLAGD